MVVHRPVELAALIRHVPTDQDRLPRTQFLDNFRIADDSPSDPLISGVVSAMSILQQLAQPLGQHQSGRER